MYYRVEVRWRPGRGRLGRHHRWRGIFSAFDAWRLTPKEDRALALYKGRMVPDRNLGEGEFRFYFTEAGWKSFAGRVAKLFQKVLPLEEEEQPGWTWRTRVLRVSERELASLGDIIYRDPYQIAIRVKVSS